MPNSERNSFDTINPIDFGEPTSETRERLTDAIKQLKNLTIGIIDEHPPVVMVDGLPDPQPLPIDPKTFIEFNYNQDQDPLFDRSEPTYLNFKIYETSQQTLETLVYVLGDFQLASIYYQSESADINYQRLHAAEHLHITEPLKPTGDPESEEYRQTMQGAMQRVQQSIATGASRPTEGTMRQLVEALESELAKRIKK